MIDYPDLFPGNCHLLRFFFFLLLSNSLIPKTIAATPKINIAIGANRVPAVTIKDISPKAKANKTIAVKISVIFFMSTSCPRLPFHAEVPALHF